MSTLSCFNFIVGRNSDTAPLYTYIEKMVSEMLSKYSVTKAQWHVDDRNEKQINELI